MMLDNNMVCSDAQAVTDSAVSTGYITVGDVGGVIGSGQNIGFRVTVTTAFATLTSLQVSLIGSTDNTFATYDVIESGPDVALADLTAGADIFKDNSAALSDTAYPYYAFYYTVTGTTATAGAVDAYFVLDQDSQHIYAKGYDL